MAKKKTKRTPKNSINLAEPDGAYVLKLVLYLILGSQWLWLEQSNGSRIPIPYGLLVGVVFAMHDHFQIDRKIEYAVLFIAMFVGFVANMGIFITV